MWSNFNSRLCVLSLTTSSVIVITITMLQYNTSEVRPPTDNGLSPTTKAFDYPRGVLISTKHGLGNQFFYYASGYALARSLNIPLLLPEPLSLRNSSTIESNNTRKREYLLDQLILPSASVVPYEEIKKHNKVRHVSCVEAANSSIISKEVQETTQYYLMDAYCFVEDYFKAYSDELKEIKVNVQNPTESYAKWKEVIGESECPIAVHVRRGDLVNENYMTTPIEYFKSAMEKMKGVVPSGINATFFVFSDEMEFAKGGLTNGSFIESLGVPVHFASGSFGGMANLEEFDLMIRCKSIVISNSTFSFWAAYLIKDSAYKVVIRPTLRATDESKKAKKKQYMNKFPEEWLTIETFSH